MHGMCQPRHTVQILLESDQEVSTLANYDGQRAHPLTGILAIPTDTTPELLKLRAFGIRLLRQTIAQAPSLTEAARRLGASYRTMVRWNHQLESTEHPRTGSRGATQLS
jgi:hypothetical protein